MGEILEFPMRDATGFLVCPKCSHQHDGKEIDADWGMVVRYDAEGFPFVAAIVCAHCGHDITLINGYLEESACS